MPNAFILECYRFALKVYFLCAPSIYAESISFSKVYSFRQANLSYLPKVTTSMSSNAYFTSQQIYFVSAIHVPK